MENSIPEEPHNKKDIILSARNLVKLYPVKNTSVMPRKKKFVHAVDGIDLEIERGETLGLVGESGCGKSTVGRLLVGIEKPTSGEIDFEGKDLIRMGRKERGSIRTSLQMIFQDSYSSLNPRKRVYDILSEPMIYHGLVKKEDAGKRVDELLGQVGLPKNAGRRYPHEFSGGQRQRISIARALSLNPELIVCDEPVSALDMSIQAQILNLLKDLQEQLGVTYLFIAHGLGAVHYVSRRIAVMYLGKIVESGDADVVFRSPAHPYSEALVSAVPVPDPDRSFLDRNITTGEVPSAVDLPKGCRFAARCPYAVERCFREEPELSDISAAGERPHLTACFVKGKQEKR